MLLPKRRLSRTVRKNALEKVLSICSCRCRGRKNWKKRQENKFASKTGAMKVISENEKTTLQWATAQRKTSRKICNKTGKGSVATEAAGGFFGKNRKTPHGRTPLLQLRPHHLQLYPFSCNAGKVPDTSCNRATKSRSSPS